jgi:hypothetical protein
MPEKISCNMTFLHKYKWKKKYFEASKPFTEEVFGMCRPWKRSSKKLSYPRTIH